MITQNIQHWSIAKCCRWLFQLKSVFIYRNHCQRINNMEFYDIFFALFCHTTQRLPDSRGHKFSQSSIRSLYITRWNNIAYRRKDRAKKKKKLRKCSMSMCCPILQSAQRVSDHVQMEWHFDEHIFFLGVSIFWVKLMFACHLVRFWKWKQNSGLNATQNTG